MKTNLLAVLALASLTPSAFAMEGLYRDQVPASVQPAWDATIVLKLYEGARYCTAFLVGKEAGNDRNVLFYWSQ
jgi:hypothetical protein